MKKLRDLLIAKINDFSVSDMEEIANYAIERYKTALLEEVLNVEIQNGKWRIRGDLSIDAIRELRVLLAPIVEKMMDQLRREITPEVVRSIAKSYNRVFLRELKFYIEDRAVDDAREKAWELSEQFVEGAMKELS
jgi:hypothetical protein